MVIEHICKVTEVDGVVCWHKCGEIVRCKDCKYALPEGRENVYICTAKKNPNYCWFDDYCSCGERRDTE